METITNLKKMMMKKLLLFFVLVTGMSTLRAQYVTIPDQVFATWLSNNGYSACMQNNRLDTTCALVLNATTLTIDNVPIYNLSGVQYFKNLISLECRHDSLGIIPALPQQLLSLDVEWNNLTSLPPLPETLLSLYCGTNPFVTLPGLPNSLKRLWCHGSFLNTMPALPDSIGDVDVSTGQLTSIPPLPAGILYFDCSNNHIVSIAEFPDTIVSFNCSLNSGLQCLPQLKKAAFIDFSGTGITCLPNNPLNADAVLSPATTPLCTAGNPNGCLFFTPGTVWPGDANHDGVANNTDLLAVGLAYGNTGPVRAGASIVWQGQAATNWTDTLANGANQKHADCNGDGVVNANDTLAILQNYGLTHAKTDDLIDPWRAGSPELSIQYSKDTVAAGDTLTVSFLLGDAATPVSNIYGLAFTYHYNPLVVDSNSIIFRYPNSWFGTGTNKINIHKEFKKPGIIRTAITGIDHINRSGNGKIAEFIATITTGNINGKNLSYFNNLTYVTEITAIDKNGKSIQINAGRDSNEVAYVPTGIKDENKALAVAVYPNPTQSSITLKVNHETLGASYTLRDVMGRAVKSGQLMQETNILSLAELEKGIYVLQIGDALKQSIKIVKE